MLTDLTHLVRCRPSAATLIAAAFCGILVMPAAARAQFTPDELSRPTTSPYLNLLNNRGNSGLNYFTQVRPQQQFRAMGSQLQNEVRGLQSGLTRATNIDPSGQQVLMQTGHPTTFLNTGGYFTGGGGGGMGSGSSGARFGGGGSFGGGGGGGGGGFRSGGGGMSGMSGMGGLSSSGSSSGSRSGVGSY